MNMRYVGVGILGAGILCGSYASFLVWGSGGAGGGVGDTRAIASKEQKSVLEEPEPIRMLFVGDMLFDRHIRKMAGVYGWEHVFSCVDGLLEDFDTVVGNLEGPITIYDSVSMGTEPGSLNNYRFTFPLETARLLAAHNIGIVSIANNHIYNFGIEGEEETKRHLDEAEVRYMSHDSPVLRVGSVSLIAHNVFGGQPANDIATLIAQEEKAGQTVIVYAHWGEEYTQSTEGMEESAKLFVANGAQLIIGSHPHVVIPEQVVGGVPVYYSLGNFIFDQYFSDDVRHGLALGVEIVGDDISLTEYPVEMFPDGRTCMFE
jgi:poly-gamma-glutamate synthesis protein (capsule biosynthesis protein)